MRDLQDIFAVWATLREMADEIGEKPSTVVKWRLRGRIPESAWPVIIDRAAARGAAVEVDDFVRLNAKPKPRGGGSPLHPNHPSQRAAA